VRVGNVVIVIKSPYSSVGVGTVSVIKRIRYDHFGPGAHLYELAGIEHNLFRAHEIKIDKYLNSFVNVGRI